MSKEDKGGTIKFVDGTSRHPIEEKIIYEPGYERHYVVPSENLIKPIEFRCSCGYIDIITRLPWICPRCKGKLVFIKSKPIK